MDTMPTTGKVFGEIMDDEKNKTLVNVKRILRSVAQSIDSTLDKEKPESTTDYQLGQVCAMLMVDSELHKFFGEEYPSE